MIDFFGLGYDAAEQMGVLPRLQGLAASIDELVYVGSDGRRRAGADYRRFAQSLDGRLLSIMRPDIERALREQVLGRVDLRYGCSVAAADDRGEGDSSAHVHPVHVELTDGASVDADLLVGADGLHSGVRGLVFGPEERFLRYLGLHTAAYTFDYPGVLAEVGDRFALTDTIDRMVGLYGLPDGRVAAFTVHRSARFEPPDDTRSAVQATYASLGWVVPDALERCPPSKELYYDQVAQVEVPTWHRGRVVLTGDACGAVSLLAGQGASLAVAGAFVLGEQLATAPSVPEALVRYERAWQPVVASKQRVGRDGIEWFLPSSMTRLLLRRVLLRLTSVPGLDRLVGNGLVGKTRASLDDLSGGRAALAGTLSPGRP